MLERDRWNSRLGGVRPGRSQQVLKNHFDDDDDDSRFVELTVP